VKIVQAAGWYHPDSLGGTEIYVAALARHFRACGHEVSVAAPDAASLELRTYSHEGAEVFRYPIPSAPTRDEAQGEVPARGADHFRRWLEQRRPDVVHFHTFVTGLGLHEIRAARRLGARVIATTHASSLGFSCQRGTLMRDGTALCDGRVDVHRCAGCELQHRGAPAPVRPLLAGIPPSIGRLMRGVPGPVGTALAMSDLIARNVHRQRAMLDEVDAFVVLTERAAEIVRANGASAAKVVVNRLGINEPITTAGRAADGDVIRVGYVGRFEEVKGVFDLAEAIRRLPRDLPLRVEFRGPAKSPAERAVKAALVERLAGDDRVTFGEGVPPAEIYPLLRSFDVLCCPSRCLEGGPTVGLEALAVGVPLIAASAGGVAEVLDDGVNARLVPPGDVGTLVAALTEVVRDPDATIRRWGTRLPPPRTMRDVALDYLSLYAGTH